MGYYITFVLDKPACDEDGNLLMEDGVDLLGGPYHTREAAVRALPRVCRYHRRYAACAALALLMPSPLARIQIVEVTRERVDAYNARHQTEIPYPPPPRRRRWLFPLDAQDWRLLRWYRFTPPPEL